jgi:hypothetical protein
MSETETKCPTCGTAVPEGAARCVACGRVFGEENRCPHCNAVAAVIRRGGKTVCAACGKPRAGATVLGSGGGSARAPGAAGERRSSSAALTRARGRAQRGFGIFALGGGVLMAVLAALILPGGFGIGMAVAAAFLGVGIGALSIRAGARSMTEAERQAAREREMRVLELAEKEGGSLTATQVAKELGTTLEEADAILTRMVGDGTRVSVDVDPNGVVHYLFREQQRRAAPPQVRVDAAEGEPAEAEVAAGAERERSAGS